eukprot:1481535-Prymnesium_polylepis.1
MDRSHADYSCTSSCRCNCSSTAARASDRATAAPRARATPPYWALGTATWDMAHPTPTSTRVVSRHMCAICMSLAVQTTHDAVS